MDELILSRGQDMKTDVCITTYKRPASLGKTVHYQEYKAFRIHTSSGENR